MPLFIYFWCNNVCVLYACMITLTVLSIVVLWLVGYINISKAHFKNKRQLILSSRSQPVLRNTGTLLLQTNKRVLLTSNIKRYSFPETETFETPLRKGEYKGKAKKEGVWGAFSIHPSRAVSKFLKETAGYSDRRKRCELHTDGFVSSPIPRLSRQKPGKRDSKRPLQPPASLPFTADIIRLLQY